ncbi:serine protease 48-like [Tribolium madens]|uniref:serine protease 48-like n=1 Tax=Tribolium madens TaxID=41895 RepID=UPI001CF7608B|nr:serine protease 48-like [Tribolium madens]
MKPFGLVIFLTASVCADPPYDNDNSSLPDDRIIGGKPTKITKFPYQVSLHNNGKFLCGGSIITRKFVLTAAHCTNHDGLVKVSI